MQIEYLSGRRWWPRDILTWDHVVNAGRRQLPYRMVDATGLVVREFHPCT